MSSNTNYQCLNHIAHEHEDIKPYGCTKCDEIICGNIKCRRAHAKIHHHTISAAALSLGIKTTSVNDIFSQVLDKNYKQYMNEQYS